MPLSYEEALATLNSMFGGENKWSNIDLDTVLRHFEGHMENTIESILSHGEGNPAILIARLENGGVGSGGTQNRSGGTDSKISLDEELARSLSSADDGGCEPIAASPSTNTTSSSSSKTKVVLPADFLRIPGYKSRGGTGNGGNSGSTMGEDETLARMLQDAFFAQELSSNPEFAHLSSGVRGNRPDAYPSTLRSNAAVAHARAMNSQQQLRQQQSGQEGPNILEKLGEMGENAKRRLSLLAAQFNAQRQQQQNIPIRRDTNNNVNKRRGLLDGNDHIDNKMSFLLNNTALEMKDMTWADKKKGD